MSEPAQPLSRRERRALEEAARAAEGEVTQALPVAPSETISIMSRRERRRLERLEHPLETWTAEEEMIATGQMPAMTPEVIAQQERLAREKAARADAEARAAAAFAGAAGQVEEPEEAEEAEERVAEVPAAPAPSGGIPADLRHLFPPGSLQARAFEAAPPEPAEPPAADAADEIRRLTHEAMEGISRVTTGATPVATEAHDEPTTHDDASPVPTMPDGVDMEELWNAPTVDEPVREPATPASGDDGAESDPARLDDVPLVQDVPVPREPEHTGTETAVPVWSALVPVSPSPQTALTPAQQPTPSAWDSHPLTRPAATPVRELPAEPTSQSLPRPDLSALLNAQANPSVGQQAELKSTEPLTSPGAMPQRIPVPPAGGGARHFRWAHLAIIGAIAFVLGVVAWNIAGSGS